MTPTFFSKATKEKKDSFDRGRDFYVEKLAREALKTGKPIGAVKLPPRRRKRVIDPNERAWAHAYLRHAAEAARLPFDSARESVQLIARYYGVELPPADPSAKRSSVVVLVAKAIEASTSIRLPQP